MKRTYWLFAMVLLGGSCKLFKNMPDKPKLERRYAAILSVEPKNDADAPFVISVASSINPPAPDTVKPKTILNFSDRGQQELIAQYAKLAKKPADLAALLNGIFFAKADSDAVDDESTKNITVTISVSPDDPDHKTLQNLALGDRLERITLDFKLDDKLQKVKLISWDHFKTQYGRFFIGSRSFTGNQDLTISPSLALTAVTASLGSYDTKNQYVEQDSLSEQVIQTNGVLSDREFCIQQNGTPKTTLMGNTILTINVGTTNPLPAYIAHFSGLLSGPSFASAAKVSVTLSRQLVMDMRGGGESVSGTLTASYLYRHIQTGDETYSEGDDGVVYYYGKKTVTPVVLVPQQNIFPDTKQLFDHNSDTTKRGLLFLADTWDAGQRAYPLLFNSYDEANLFLMWLNAAVQPDPPVKGKKKKKKEEATPAPQVILLGKRYLLVKIFRGIVVPLQKGFDASRIEVQNLYPPANPAQ